MNIRHIRVRLAVANLVVFGGILVLYAFGTSWFFLSTLNDQMDGSLKEEVELVEQMLLHSPDRSYPPDIHDDNIHELERFIEIWSVDGRLLYRSRALGESVLGDTPDTVRLHSTVVTRSHLLSNGTRMRVAGLVGTHEYNRNEANDTYFNPADTTKRLNEFMNFSTAANAAGGRGTWVDTNVPRQHHQQYHDMMGSAHYTNSFVEMSCFTCHSSHKPTANEKDIVDSLTVGADRFKVSDKDNTLCLACHATHGPFTSIQKAWVQNPVAFKDSIGRYVNGHTKHNLYDPANALNTGGGGRCSKCHMTLTAITANAFDIATHTWGVIAPNATRRYSTIGTPSLGMINTCAASCHRNPVGTTASVPSFGIGTDANLSDWREATDLALADTLWYFWRQWGFTSVKQIAASVPRQHSLSQNYPNPFNPSTKINVTVAERGQVQLIVYNVIGQEVVRLMDGDYNRGQYEVTWNGKDYFGQTVATGLYIYRLEAGSFTATKKMLLVK